MVFKKKKQLSLAQLKIQNRKLAMKHQREEELKEARQEQYKLKHRKSIAFFQGVSRVSSKVGKTAGKYIYKKATAKPKKISKGYKPMNVGDLF